jgi:hypothetical protein
MTSRRTGVCETVLLYRLHIIIRIHILPAASVDKGERPSYGSVPFGFASHTLYKTRVNLTNGSLVIPELSQALFADAEKVRHLMHNGDLYLFGQFFRGITGILQRLLEHCDRFGIQ